MEIDVLLRIAGIGLLIAVICQILTKAGREEIATLAAVAGMILVLVTVIDLFGQLLQRVQAIFSLA